MKAATKKAATKRAAKVPDAPVLPSTSLNPSGLAHEPTEQYRKIVETAAGYGLPHKMIATLVGLGSDNTLRKHYADQLAAGEAKACFAVAQTLYIRATTGKDLGAAIFFLKAKAGFREKHLLDDPETRADLVQLLRMSGIDDTPPAPTAYVAPQKDRLQ